MKLLIIANSHRPLHDAWSSGMELSTLELLDAFAIFGDQRLRRLAVVAHPDTVLPSGVELIPRAPMPCPPHYSQYGDGPSKWSALAMEAILGDVDICQFDIVHDQSSTMAGALLAVCAGIPYVKTCRLMPYHPSAALSLRFATRAIYLSHFQRRFDTTTDASLLSILRDPTPVPQAAIGCERRSHAVCVGRVERRKGTDLAAHAAAARGQELYVIGPVLDDELARELSGMSHVRILGALPRHQALLEIARASLLIWTPRVPEPTGRVVLESLQLGTPVLGTAIGYVADLVATSAPSAAVFGYPLHFVPALMPEWRIDPLRAAEAHFNLYQDCMTRHKTRGLP